MELNLNKTFNLYSSMDLLFFALFCSFVPIARLAVVISIIYTIFKERKQMNQDKRIINFAATVFCAAGRCPQPDPARN